MPSPSLRLRAAPELAPAVSADAARRAFDAVAEITRAPTMAALQSAFAPAVEAIGFRYFVSVVMRDREMHLIDGRTHPTWYPHLIAEGRWRHGAAAIALREGAGALFYSELYRHYDLTPDEQRLMEMGREFHIGEGFSISVEQGDSAYVVAMSGDAVEVHDPDVRAASLVLSTFYGVASRSLAAPAPAGAKVVLTQRQKDCLCWVREGKSATDIADILGISVYTVHEHVGRACARLGVRTRVQAVATAIHLGLIPV
jgi:DNA-binding CsgD family transcriptional regulator